MRQMDQTSNNIDKRTLVRKRELIGAEAVLIVAFLYQPFVMLFTENTAIARFGVEYGDYATVYAISIIIAVFMMMFDVVCSFSDIWRKTYYTRGIVWRKIDHLRPWILIYCAIWELMLYTPVQA